HARGFPFCYMVGFRPTIYCKRLNFCEDLILIAYDSRKIGPANNSGNNVNTTEATFDLGKLEPANNLKFPALSRFAKI
ncbi:MAG: hypothetical protein PV344_05960, partial [Anaplasma sp.]|nr:hypothetical protein [Anaplasma sp.]